MVHQTNCPQHLSQWQQLHQKNQRSIVYVSIPCLCWSYTAIIIDLCQLSSVACGKRHSNVMLHLVSLLLLAIRFVVYAWATIYKEVVSGSLAVTGGSKSM